LGGRFCLLPYFFLAPANARATIWLPRVERLPAGVCFLFSQNPIGSPTKCRASLFAIDSLIKMR
jgi:hypothetical protein